MSSQRIIAAIDVGSFKICCFIAEVREGGPVRVFGMSHQASDGVRRGEVNNIRAAQGAISSVVHAAEQMAGTQVHEAIISLNGPHVMSTTMQRDMAVGGPVRDVDVRRLLQESRAAVPINGRTLIHALPTDYEIDGSRQTSDPRGLHAQTLGVRMTVVTADNSPVQDLLSCVAQCHLEARDLVAAPYAAGLSALVEDERDLGATLIDMGGGTTSVAVFYEGAAVHTAVVPVGGIHITNDIARGLSTATAQAERLKTLYGSALRLANDDREMIDAPQIGEDGDGAQHQAPRSYLTSIIAPRVEETLELVRDQLQSSGLASIAGQRVVLVGGASLLPGVRELASKILDKQVRLGRPLRIAGLADATGGPAFAACAGLLSYAVDNRGEARQAAIRKPPQEGGFIARMGGWFRENL